MNGVQGCARTGARSDCRARRPSSAHKQRGLVLCLEELEDRTLPSINSFDFTGNALTLQGNAAYAATALNLTDGGANEAGSAFYSMPVNVNNFASDFSFQLTNPVAGGLTFTVQGNGPAALGGGGSGLGYQEIANSLAIKFDLGSSTGVLNSTALLEGGTTITTQAISFSPSGINLYSEDLFAVHVAYDGSTLTVRETVPPPPSAPPRPIPRWP
jgi:hypothetical protein